MGYNMWRTKKIHVFVIVYVFVLAHTMRVWFLWGWCKRRWSELSAWQKMDGFKIYDLLKCGDVIYRFSLSLIMIKKEMRRFDMRFFSMLHLNLFIIGCRSGPPTIKHPVIKFTVLQSIFCVFLFLEKNDFFLSFYWLSLLFCLIICFQLVCWFSRHAPLCFLFFLVFEDGPYLNQ